ncbi:MAG: DinB family protein [bacterium]
MRETERIVGQLNRAFVGEAWHGPAVLELLKGVTAEQATARPIAGGHSIWELALHIEAWVRAGGRRLQADPAQLTEVEDWPAVTASDEQAWQQVRESIKQAHNELASATLLLDEARLDQPIIKDMSSVYVTLHGVIQHSLYHAGQIAILKRAPSERKTA